MEVIAMYEKDEAEKKAAAAAKKVIRTRTKVQKRQDATQKCDKYDHPSKNFYLRIPPLRNSMTQVTDP